MVIGLGVKELPGKNLHNSSLNISGSSEVSSDVSSDVCHLRCAI